jgi:divalent metal cation (Fe/Co/Zn/Cd) transporter
MRLEDAHKVAEELEEKIREEMNIEATIHVEPIIARRSKKQLK